MAVQTPSVDVIRNRSADASRPSWTSTFSRSGRVDLALEGVEIVEDFVLDHEAVRVGAGIGMAGQLALPVRRDEAERVPPLVAPFVHARLLLEHDMVEPARLET